ncbi:hypothetical protein [Actinomadura sp. WMMB 499]|uniref:hypothetical protein n=1 Tax=Actinomadura sp. WMMB 499 TaxID=1219491 RepID=UPI00159DBB06|nr:hypothetical protein [Actinomadura sp. WMMB 499]
MFFMLALIIALAVLGPLLGADSRDGLDHAPGHFWRRRPFRPRTRGAGPRRDPASPAPAQAESRRTIPAAG